METLVAGILAVLAVISGVVILVTVLTCLRAFVLLKLWAWFIVPLFGLPPLTIPYAIGISLIVGSFFLNTKKQDDSNVFWVSAIVSPLITLFIGWIVHMFI